ncbi:FUSC family protein [Streptomyces sp. BK239]|uniref:FUSC family protein n=1 Tax=Streptomyces sp. BK239 TaxID=2512155 RepID=UPI00102AB853|nr:FUSC family protein [Streptomyces sp. BK239]RZU18227.1 putative membrane protein YccC [Streptomyces sp. BK239]
MSSATPRRPRPPARLPLAGALRLGRPSDIWFKPALSVVAAVAPPNLTLLALDRLDLAMYTMAGSLCALYAHNRPYAARARALAWVVLGMTGGLAVALLTASLTANAVVLVTVGALLAAVQKALCDATRVGPPGNIVLTFISSATLFVPQTPGQIPGHLALALAAGAWAWLIGMAPGPARPHGPERRATAQALNAAAAYAAAHGDSAGSPVAGAAGAQDGHAHARAAAAAAVHAAWQTLLWARDSEPRRALQRLLVRAEVALAAPADSDPERLRAWARRLRGTGTVPRPDDLVDDDELLGLDATLAVGQPPLWRRLGPLAPLAVRTALGCALAGYVALALGIGRPYWALVTAASLYQANVTLTWSRGLQRVVGNLVGVLAYAALVPVAHFHQAALVLVCLALNFGAEALISRNYWLGSVCVTPMALLITEFARHQDAGELITERVVDTLVGALVGFAAAVAVTNRRAGDRLGQALTAAERARADVALLLAESQQQPRPRPAPDALESARRSLAAALVHLRTTADAAAGEWWQRALPEERVMAVEQAGHRTLAATARRQKLLARTAVRDTSAEAEATRP